MMQNGLGAIDVRHIPNTRGSPAGTRHSRSSLGDTLARIGVDLRFAANAEIYGADEPADYVYMVAEGAVRVCQILEDGRRQINAFHLPGDLFGLEAGASHQLTAEAISDSLILVVKRSSLEAAAARDNEVIRALWMITAGNLHRAHHHMLLLGRKSATERLASFLLEMAARTATEAIKLPMSRQDIADYLGLTIETVSRVLAHLRRTAAINIPSSRRTILCNRDNLQLLDG